MKSKLLLFAAAGLAIAASVPTFAAGTSSAIDAKSATPLDLLTADAQDATMPPTTPVSTCIAKVDYMGIKSAISSSPGAWTIAKTRGAIDDSSATLKTALLDSPAQCDGGSSFATTTLAASSGTSTAAPAIGYSVTDLAKLTKPERTAVVVITA